MAESTEEQKNDAGDNGGITSPEGVLMLFLAGIIDTISLIPIINVVSDILGIIVIGGWLVITRPGEALKKATKRFLIACGVELIPVVSIAPTWVWFVYKTLNDK
ncbi:MAG: hypothetical protein A2528_00095 [Candidatus Staskawiczbacteria bacterium RIFOXYD2_FULL_37_9]|uniref:Uncharacterized protein n=1 Tax=Candidatus Staskawiczbacteria bacterium RIFOXYB1_FULL_37_44 TaxID=1802223 RepID=A0A1G2IVN7_9BACT|nr:MAG: hypothetical protein A2358_02570 [Candidatus Staskawiczbacteria bacterium RIFOXYB1_FULL_37_44]OGZ84283.1 MAG: hypothetical protein A2416_01390 [Candidatus Staskawiczbacteria bacterium RIFOXYC1_FULL_37_52]OGZ89156.1 MAG: hypothetical protein A2581_01430 [Candidatus Staskawiczbacteria bacterium RIFOXYD1_FULL_37_110]OGZ89439.1 MAG: hypothetical protein A2444_04050 [Candidatus Staskawiczbacteria bacterium RIFOXYC2_FULL_37_19]OGZ94688.1 MAG: hypothetical protein A2528_00095 [Candidatus Stask